MVKTNGLSQCMFQTYFTRICTLLSLDEMFPKCQSKELLIVFSRFSVSLSDSLFTGTTDHCTKSFEVSSCKNGNILLHVYYRHT